MTATDMKHFEKFVELSVTFALQSNPCGTQAFYEASKKMSAEFALIRDSGYEFGPWKKEFDDLFLQPVNAMVLDVHCVFWIRCRFPGAPDGLRGWIPAPRGMFANQIRHYAVSDDHILRTEHNGKYGIGPLALGPPVLEILGNARPGFDWLVDE